MTVAAMLVSWKSQSLVTQEELARQLGQPWLERFLSDSGLPRDQYATFAEALGLAIEWPANHLPVAYARFLRKHGPLLLTTSDSVSSHARLLVATEWSEESNDMLMVFIDPLTGTERRQQFALFFAEFEREAVLIVAHRPDVPLPIQILHW